MACVLTFLLSGSGLAASSAQALSSLQSYTGIWDMPNARILPDWNLRIKYGTSDPYAYYGGALGLFDRLEVEGQFTEVKTIIAFGHGYGYYKDRSSGFKLILLRETQTLPQVALGMYDITGNALWGKRYLVMSKMFGDLDLTLGVGQGTLAGTVTEDRADEELNNKSNLLSTWATKGFTGSTKPFGGLEYHITPDMTFSAEYSPIKYEQLYGAPKKAEAPVNVGLKYKLTDKIYVAGGLMRGDVWSGTVGLDTPLDPEGMMVWRKEKPYEATEKLRWDVYEAGNDKRAEIISKQLVKDGFDRCEVAVSDDGLWVAAESERYQSDAMTLGRMASVVRNLAPASIRTFYLNIQSHGQTVQSLKASRADLDAYLNSVMDTKGFLTYADYTLYGAKHWEEFQSEPGASRLTRAENSKWKFEVYPRFKTLVNDANNFFLFKVYVDNRVRYSPWKGGQFVGELEIPLYNEMDKASAKNPLEDPAAHTDFLLYEERSGVRPTMLAYDQKFVLPKELMSSFSVGYFDTMYVGVGGELFRFFNDGIWGLGLESEAVRKRDYGDMFALRSDTDKVFSTAFLNMYCQVWPEKGVEAGMKVGRFLGGDNGVRFELRRSFNYFTIGGWFTKTVTGNSMSNPDNKDYMEKGVYIQIPLSLFNDVPVKGNLEYGMTGFTRDTGQTVRQPDSLYPLNNYSTPEQVRRRLDEMRQSN